MIWNARNSGPVVLDVKASSPLQEFRADKDEFFARDPRSPLTPAQQQRFKGLAYFPESANLAIRARIDRKVEPGIVRMETTKGEPQIYQRYGVVSFEVDGQQAQVTLYAAEASHELFVPFRDATSGRETYGGGRYLDLHAHGEEIEVDFNYAYNPYCAYNPDWNCPLPPAENWMKVPIRAGEMAFSDGPH